VSVLRSSSSLFLYLLGIVVIVAAIGLSLVRLAIPYADDFRYQIQSTISHQVGRDVSIGEIDASWHHFSPQIELDNVVIALADEQLLEFGRVSLGVDIVSSIAQRRLVTSEIRLAGFELNIVQTLDGRFAVAGLPASAQPIDIEQQRKLLRWLSKQQQVVVENGTLYFTSEQRPELLHIFSRAGVYFVNSNGGYQLAVQIDLPSSLGESVELVANFDGLPLLHEEWSVENYVKLSNVSMLGLTDEFFSAEAEALKVKGGEVDLELWATLDSHRAVFAQGRITAENLRFGSNSSAEANFDGDLIINALSANYALQKEGDEWAMAFDPLRIARVGASEQTFDLQLRYNNDDQDRSLLLQVGAYRSGEVLDLLKSSPFISSDRLSKLDSVNFGGDISQTTLSWRQADEAELAVYIEFDNTFVRESEHLPGIDGLAGFMSYAGGGGQISLSGASSQFDASMWFRDSLHFDELAIDVAWENVDSGTFIDARNISISNPDLAVKGGAMLQLPSDKALSPYVDLALDLERVDISKHSLYLPAKIMNPKALLWYDRALRQGVVSKGTVELKGPVKQFPFEVGGGKFDIDLHIENGELEYKEGWPAIDNMDADLRIHNANVELELNAGSVINTKIVKAKMSIADFTIKPVAIAVTGVGQGASSAALLFLEQSPLKKRFENALNVLSVEGESTLSLELDIPLPGPVNVYGELEIANNRLAVSNDAFVAENIVGRLSFDNQGLHGKAISADIFGMEVLVDLKPITKGGKRGTKFSGRGVGDVEQYAKLSGLPWLTRFAQGSSQWKAEVSIVDDHPEFYVESDLVGVISKAPYPLSKQLDETKHFSMDTILPFGSQPVSLTFGDEVKAELVLERKGSGSVLSLLSVGLGGVSPELQVGTKGITVKGDLDRLIVDEWMAASTTLFGDEQTGDALSVSTDLDVGSLEVFGYQWDDVSVAAMQQQGNWHATLIGEGINGVVKTEGERSNVHITLVMDSLALDVDKKQSELTDEVFLHNDLDPRIAPTVDVRISQFNYGDFDLGELAFKTSRIKQGQHFEDIAIRMPTLLLAGAGNWTQAANGQRSSFNVSAETGDISEMLSHFDYAVENVDGGASTVDANVFWQGMPSDYSNEKLNGQLALTVNNISFSDIDPGAGRVFGLLSIQALPQRLSLDFSDLFKKGLKINTIKGNFSVKNGDAMTDDLFMKGPSVRIDIAGRIGLAAQDYDQIMAVTPEVSSSLPLVGAAVAGPAGAGIGTAIMFLHKLFNPKILHYKYHVSGPWKNPNVTLLNKSNPPVHEIAEEPGGSDE